MAKNVRIIVHCAYSPVIVRHPVVTHTVIILLNRRYTTYSSDWKLWEQYGGSLDLCTRLQMTQPTSGGAVTAESSCCANCVESPAGPAPSTGGPIYRFLGMRTRWMAGAAAHKSG